MVYAQARSPRLGQPTSVESAYVRMFSGDELPEAAWEGQLIYRNENQGLQIFNGNAWEDVVGGVAGTLTFVGSTPPLAQSAGDIWFDSSDDNRIYVAAAAGADAIAPGEWESVAGSIPPVTATTWIYHQDTPPGPASMPPPKDNDFWFETPDNKQYYYQTSAPGTHWVGVRDAAIDDAITTSVIEYALNSSETVAPTTGWSAVAPTRTPGTFIWVRTTTTRVDGTVSTSSPALMTGNTGAPGSTGSQGIPGPSGTSLYTWLKYADTPTTGMSDSPAGKTYMGLAYNKTSSTESSTYADYDWSLIVGPQGNTGVQGPAGADGLPTYTWVKYADTPTTGISDLPAGKAYIGLAYNKGTPTETTNYADYAWSLILGPQGPAGSQGIQGPAGADGTSRYTWIKYADTPTTGMNDLPAGKVYMGIAYNKTSSTESSTYGDYEWSLIQGPQGNTGIQGPAGADGTPRYTWIKYADSITGTGLSDSPVGKTYLGIAYNKTTATESSTPGDYEWSLIQGPQGPQGATGSQGIQGPAGADGTPRYTWIKYADTPTTGMNDLPAGKIYMGIAYNKLTATESSTYGDYEWSLIQGPQGNTGIQGPAGTNGQPTYTWIKYADTVLGAGLSDSPVGKTYLGIAYNKTTATESSVTTDYEWSLIQGPQGPAGSNGSNGVSITAVTPYYATVNTGTGAPTQPTNQATPPGPWQLTEPAYIVGKELYRTEKMTYSNATYTYSTVVLVSSYTAAGAAMTAANGKNTVYYASTAPTGGTYIAGDTWFDVANSYQLNNYVVGTGWVPNQFGAAAIADASITNAKITDATIESAKIVGLDAGKITAGSMTANLVVGGMLTTSQTGLDRRVEITSGGLINWGPDVNGVMIEKVKLPTNGEPAQFQGKVEADELTVKGAATLQGLTNIATGQDLNLNTGVSPPPVSPTVSAVYATESAADPVAAGGTGGSQKWGMVWDGTYWNRLIIKSSDNKYYMQRLTTTGTVFSTTNTGITAQSSPKINFFRTSSRWYFIFRVANAPFAAWQVNERDHSFANIGSWNYTSNQDTNNLPAIVFRTDSTLGSVLTIAQVKSDGSMGLRHYTTSGSLQNTGTFNPSSPYNSVTDLGGAYVGEADFTGGVGRILIPIRKGDYAFCEVFTEASMAYDATRSFPLCSFAAGIGYNGTTTTNGQLWSSDRDLLTLIQYSTLLSETGSSMYFSAGAAATYYDSTGATRETTPGPIRMANNLPKRCSVRLSIGALSPGADSVRFHYTPASTLTPFATQPTVGSLTALYTSLATHATQTTPTVSGFISGAASRLLAGAVVLLEGDKYGTFAPGDLKMIGYVPAVASGTVVTAGGSWLYCDGATVSTTTFARLFAVIGHAYNGGVDPGGGNFKLPDMRSRMPIGAGTFAPIGTADNAATEALRTTLHTHGIPDQAGHAHGIGGLSTSTKTMQDAQNTATGGTNAGRLTGIAGNIDHNHNVTGSLADNSPHAHGGATGDGNRNGIPYQAVGYLIKI